MAGIAEQLRQAVLQAAIQGKLTEQLPEDGNARDLLAEIQSEKAILIAEKKIKKEKSLMPIAEDSVPFEIPRSWKWTYLQNIVNIRSASRVHQSDWRKSGVPFYRAREIVKLSKNGFVDNELFVDEELYNKYASEDDVPVEGDLMVSGVGTLGASYIVKDTDKFYYKDASVLCFENRFGVYPAYLRLLMETPLMMSQIYASEAYGTTVATLTMDRAYAFVLPLPPLAEQHRIVARVEELMAKIDELEKVENELNALHKAFPGDMKAALLQAAMQGKLTEQLPEDGNAEDLLKSIEAEKGKLIAEKKIKKQKALEPIADDEIPFEIPDNWKWNRLRNLVYNRGQKTPVKEFSYIDIGSIDNIHQRLNDNETIIPAAEAPSRARKIVGLGDILYSTVRPYLHNACIIDKNFRAEPIASTGFAVLTCYKGVNSKYLLYYMLSPAFDQYANATDNAKGVAYPAINDEKLYKAVVPLPPLAEQQRIVEKLDKLLPLCDSLEEKL